MYNLLKYLCCIITGLFIGIGILIPSWFLFFFGLGIASFVGYGVVAMKEDEAKKPKADDYKIVYEEDDCSFLFFDDDTDK